MRIGNPLRSSVASRANERCEYCHYPEQFSPSSGFIKILEMLSTDYAGF